MKNVISITEARKRLPGLDFTGIRGKKRKTYFEAVQSGLDRDYEPMKKVFRFVLSWTRRKHAPR